MANQPQKYRGYIKKMETISKIIPKLVRNRIGGYILGNILQNGNNLKSCSQSYWRIYFRQCLESTFPSGRYDFCPCENRDPKDENEASAISSHNT